MTRGGQGRGKNLPVHIKDVRILGTVIRTPCSKGVSKIFWESKLSYLAS